MNVTTVDVAEKRKQVLDQCRAVAHMANIIAKLYSPDQLPSAYSSPAADDILDIAGNRTVWLMERLGDAINGMDAVEEGDEWMTPIFIAAHKMFPQDRDN